MPTLQIRVPSDEDRGRAIRHGVRPDVHDDDLRAIHAYLSPGAKQTASAR